MRKIFKNLDIAQRYRWDEVRFFGAPYVGFMLIYPIFATLNKDLMIGGVEMNWGDFYFSWPFWLLFILGAGLCVFHYGGRYKKKRIANLDSAGYYRDTKGIFDFDDPMSILEVLVLCNDYSGGADLGVELSNENVRRLIVNTMIKTGAIVKITKDEIVVDDAKLDECEAGKKLLDIYFRTYPNQINNLYRKAFFHLPTCPKRENEKTLLQQAIKPFAFNISNLTSKRKGTTIFNFKKTSSVYSALIEIFRTVAAENRRMFKNFNLNSFFETLMIGLDFDASIVVEKLEKYTLKCQKDVKKKYFAKSGGRRLPVASFAVVIYLALAVYFYRDHLPSVSFYIILLLVPVVFFFFDYLYYLGRESSEVLNEEGQEIFNRVLGLRHFIVDFTNIPNVKDASLIAWDEIAIFANLFGLNDNVRDIFRKEGIWLKHSEIYDYLRPLTELDFIDEKMREFNLVLSAIANEGIKTEGLGRSDAQSVTKKRIVGAPDLTPNNIEKIISDAGLKVIQETSVQ